MEGRFPPSAGEAWRPAVTVAYAQSLDGCIALERGVPTALSGSESLLLTHRLRAAHAGILVGVGTVLADDPRLNTRLVPGGSPRPIVLDSRLRTPPGARLFAPAPDAQGGEAARRPIIACDSELLAGEGAGRARSLEGAGAVLLPIERRAAGTRAPLPLRSVLAGVLRLGVTSVMVEGGASIIRSFVRAGHVDELCVTTAPVLLAGGPRFGREPGAEQGGGFPTAGVPAAEASEPAVAATAQPPAPSWHDVVYEQHGRDMVLFASAQPRRATAASAADAAGAAAGPSSS